MAVPTHVITAAADANATPPATSPSAPLATDGPRSAGSVDAGQIPISGQWQRELQQSIVSLEKELASESIEAEDRCRLEATLRMLYVAAQRRDDAVRAIEGMDAGQQGFWKMGLAGVFELVDPNGPPIASRRSKLALRYLREAVQELGAASSLDVRNLAICRRVDSFGQFVEFDPYQFTAEQEVILYVEVSNFAVEETSGGFETELQGTYQVMDEQGHRIEDYDLPPDRQVCRNVRTDYFVPYRIFLSKNLAPGDYKIQVMIEDKKGKKFGQTPAVPFQIRK